MPISPPPCDQVSPANYVFCALIYFCKVVAITILFSLRWLRGYCQDIEFNSVLTKAMSKNVTYFFIHRHCSPGFSFPFCHLFYCNHTMEFCSLLPFTDDRTIWMFNVYKYYVSCTDKKISSRIKIEITFILSLYLLPIQLVVLVHVGLLLSL